MTYPSWSVKYDPSLCSKAVELFKQGKSITAVAVSLGIVRDTYYRWKEEYPEFGQACAMGEQLSQAYWESRGEEGIFGEIDKFAGSSWQFTMKSRFRDCYSDQAPKDLKDTLIEKLLEKV